MFIDSNMIELFTACINKRHRDNSRVKDAHRFLDFPVVQEYIYLIGSQISLCKQLACEEYIHYKCMKRAHSSRLD